MKLAKVNPLKVELIAPTEYFGLIQKGMEVEIYPEQPANQVFTATVSVVDQLIDPASGSFTVRMALPNPGDELVAGVNCMASFNFKAPVPLRQNTYSSLSPS
jgi:multidrug efflux pump subunit AcrA (membrane-fusion protein)